MPERLLDNAVILEALARMAYFTLGINRAARPVASALHDKHYLQKTRSRTHITGRPRIKDKQ